MVCVRSRSRSGLLVSWTSRSEIISAHTVQVIELSRDAAHSGAGPAAYFACWVGHDTWPEWSPDTGWVRVAGPVTVGTRGVLKPQGAPRVKLDLAKVVGGGFRNSARADLDRLVRPGEQS